MTSTTYKQDFTYQVAVCTLRHLASGANFLRSKSLHHWYEGCFINGQTGKPMRKTAKRQARALLFMRQAIHDRYSFY